MYNLAFSIAPADVLAPSGFRTSACAVMTTFLYIDIYLYKYIYISPAGLDCINPLRAKFLIENMKMCLQFMSFLHTDMTHVDETLLHVRQELTYFT